jgi:hypothetical protein
MQDGMIVGFDTTRVESGPGSRVVVSTSARATLPLA